jgi:hypothetical protein
MFTVGVGAYTLVWSLGRNAFALQRHDEALIKEIGQLWSAKEVASLAVYLDSARLPFLVIAIGQNPWYPEHHPTFGAQLIPETHTLFVGANEEVLAFDLRKPALLWRDNADSGFWSLQRYGDFVLMAAELTLVAWDLYGTKQWATFVEPPYDYTVTDGTVHLTVLSVPATFPLAEGPSWHGNLPWRAQ